MKTLYIAVLCILPSLAFAQTDSLSYRLARLEMNNAEAGKYLTKYYATYTKGKGVMLGGFALTALGIGLFTIDGQAFKDNSLNAGGPIIVIGGITSLIGCAMQLHSHTNIKKAGIILSGGTVAIPLRRERQEKIKQ